MNLVKQPLGKRTCGQCCVAMIAGISREEAIRVVGKKAGTVTADVRTALLELGFSLGKNMRINQDNSYDLRTIPLAVVLAWMPHESGHVQKTHWMVLANGKIYCPDRGRMDVTDWSALIHHDKRRERLTSYFEVRHE